MGAAVGVSVAVTVVVCTRDRLALLRACLESLDRQILPEGGLEVVVVDNGSTDGTAAWLRRWANESPDRRRVVTEPEPGLSRARNAGAAAARGDVVCFLDDDAFAPRGWVVAHLDAYRRRPGAVGAGGPVVLGWPDGRPGWLAPRLEHWFSAVDRGDQPGDWPPPHGPYGTNMSVRREALVDAGGFAARLGRRGRSLLSGEEAHLWQRLWAAGHTVAYEPAALVIHRVAAARLSRRWVLRRGWAQGRSNARLRVLDTPYGAAELRSVCREELRHAGAAAGMLVLAAARADGPALLDELARRLGHLSAMVEHVRLAAASQGWWERARAALAPLTPMGSPAARG